jgi:hypothetical protein
MARAAWGSTRRVPRRRAELERESDWPMVLIQTREAWRDAWLGERDGLLAALGA